MKILNSDIIIIDHLSRTYNACKTEQCCDSAPIEPGCEGKNENSLIQELDEKNERREVSCVGMRVFTNCIQVARVNDC